jgi:rhodanese-related sulfurtransferase
VPLRLGRIAVIAAASLLCGLAWNTWSGRGIALGANAFLRAGAEEIPATEARERFDRGALFLDARPVANYEMSHIPGAVPLPEDDFDRHFTLLEARLRSNFDAVVYCAGYGCEASHLVAERLKGRGIHVAILNEGWPAWTDAGYPVKEGREP